MMELSPTWLTPGTTDSLLLLVGEQPQTDLIAGAAPPPLPLCRGCQRRTASCVAHSRVLTVGSGRGARRHTGPGLGHILCQQACLRWGGASPLLLDLARETVVQIKRAAGQPRPSATGATAHRGGTGWGCSEWGGWSWESGVGRMEWEGGVGRVELIVQDNSNLK